MVIACYALPMVAGAVFSVALGLLGDGPLGVRLIILLVIPVVFLLTVVIMVLRALAFARPGLVRAGLGREWVAVSAPEDIAVDTGAGRWPQICVFNNPKSPALVTTPGPLWFGSQRRFRQALEAARDELAAAAFPDAPAPTARQ